MKAKRLAHDMKLDTDPASALWRGAPAITFERGPRNEFVPGYRTKVLARWTPEAVYFLFVCPYKELYLTPEADAVKETNKIWDYDVAEVFIGSDFKKIWQYREFEITPQNQWVDLDIDLKQPKPEGGWLWNSGFDHAARVDKDSKTWYAAFRIPVKSFAEQPAAAGAEYRINLYRIEGPEPHRNYLSWRPTGSPSYHVPEAFGLLRLED